MSKALVLSDELLQEFYNFKNNISCSNSNIEKLLHYYKLHSTNIAQLKRLGIDNKILFSQLAQSGYLNQTLEDLAQNTMFKIILNTQVDIFPYINILNDKIENNFTSTFYKNKSREKAQAHIKSLLLDAQHIFIYDRYLTSNWSSNKSFFEEIVSRRKLNIYYANNHFNQDDIKKIKNIHKDWKISEDKVNKNYRNMHDRYLIIDNKIELILTSGFEYLFDDSKDFTYILREKR